jgi:hypothetical protein
MVMITRQKFIHGATASTVAAVGAPFILQACSSQAGQGSYESVVQSTWHPVKAPAGDRALLHQELVRYATLAPSSHNTQCWKFHIEDDAITIAPDLARRTPAVDPDDHHLYVSLGCATENLVQAALANALKGDVRVDLTPGGGSAIKVALEPTKAVVSPLYLAMPERQCTRAEYDGQPLSTEELRLLEQAGTGKGVRVMMFTGSAALESILAYVVEGNTAQMNDPAFLEELKSWIRFGSGEAVKTGDGLYSAASGNQSVPRWLGSRLFGMFFTPKSENDKYAKHVRSSAGVAVFISEASDQAHWVEAGRCYERFALQATALGIRNAMLNQPVEVSALRPQFATAFSMGSGRPDLVVRFGRGPLMPKSLRRNLQSVLV